ncbi:MAG: N-acetylmuramic acid 6-phosphate etherase [Candidatus Zixiibacteriota bacterium]
MGNKEDLIKQLSRLETEQVNPETIDIDRLSPLEDKKVALVVENALSEIARAAVIYAETLKSGGRVFYMGAGTSGRLGVLDAAECPPTFGTDPNRIIGLISGGYDSLVLSKEGAEDDSEAAVNDLKRHEFSKDDFLIGLAASKRTPYTQAGLEYAHSIGAKTAFIICNRWDSSVPGINVVIPLPVGPEVITGSTRMKSGTAQKMALNMISTTAMVLLGKTYGNLMVDLRAWSEKLAARSRKILMGLFQIPLPEVENLLDRAGGSVKTAIVMYKFRCGKEEAEKKLERADGFISRCR